MNIEQAQALEMICYYAKEHLKDNKTMSQSVDIAKDIIKKELKEKEKQDNYTKSLEDRIDNLETSYLRDRKALEIIKEMLDNDLIEKLNANSRKIFKDVFDNLPKEKQDLLKEVLL